MPSKPNNSKSTERKNEEETAHLATFPSLNPDPIVEIDYKGHVLYSNESAKKLFPDLSIRGFSHPFLRWVESAVEEFKIQKNEAVTFEVKALEHWYYQRVFPMPNKQVIRIYASNIDLRKKAEEALRESEEKYRLIVETANEGIWVASPDGKTTFINQRMVDMLGYRKEDILGHTGLEFMDSQQAVQVFENRRILKGKNNVQFECKFIRKDGVTIWTLANTAPILDRDGKHIANIAMHTDITERKKAEEALKQSEEKLRAIAESSTVEISVSSLDGTMLFVNDAYAETFGYSKSELIGFHTPDLYVDPKDREKLIEALRNKGFVKNFETRVKRKDGTVFWIAASINLINYGGQKAVIGVSTDITEHRKAEEALKNSEQAAVRYANELKAVQERLEVKSSETEQYATRMESLAEERAKLLRDSERFAAIGATAGMVGHDIRNPLQAITGDIYLLNDNLAELSDSRQKSEMKESIDEITKNVSYINKIVADLQDYARPLKPEYSLFDLPKAISEALKAIIVPDNIKLIVKEETIKAFKCDQTYLRRSVTNLVNNAIQAMPNGGTLEVASFAKGSRVYITVSDTGVGIPESVKAKLFTPMMTTKAKGQGLGLAVAKRLIEALGGNIGFESEEGKGTKFIIELPNSTST